MVSIDLIRKMVVGVNIKKYHLLPGNVWHPEFGMVIDVGCDAEVAAVVGFIQLYDGDTFDGRGELLDGNLSYFLKNLIPLDSHGNEADWPSEVMFDGDET